MKLGNVRTWALALAGVLVAGASALAADIKIDVNVNRDKSATTQPGQQFTPALLRIGALMHREVKNANSEKIGRIEDIVLNHDQSRASYAVVVMGGVWGMGGKYLAIPWSAFSVDTSNNTVTLNLDKQRLENAPGFDKKHWPDMGNPEWSLKNDREYGYSYSDSSGREMKATVREGYTGMKAQYKGEHRDNRLANRENVPFWARKVSDLVGLDIKNYQGEDLGSIEDLYIDTHDNYLVYARLSFGGVLGIGEKNVVVPWSALEMRPQLHTARCDIEKKTLDALAFKQGDSPDLTNQDYARKLYSYFHQEPYWEVFGYVGEKTIGASTLNMEAWKAGSDYNRKFDAATVITVKGTIESVGTFRLAANSPEGLRLRIKTDEGQTATVHCGPAAFATQNGFEFHYGDRITVTGSKTNYSGRSILMASEIKADGKDLKLRGMAGEPLWNVDKLFGVEAK